MNTDRLIDTIFDIRDLQLEVFNLWRNAETDKDKDYWSKKLDAINDTLLLLNEKMNGLD